MTLTPDIDPTGSDITVSNEPKVDLVLITPEQASLWLAERNNRNRRLAKDRVARYVEEIKSGQWQINGASVAFSRPVGDQLPQLLDGQHRLSAVKDAGVAVTTVLVTGLEPQSQDTMDQGAKRTVGNVLQIHGFSDPNNVAATAQHCWGYVNGTLGHVAKASRRGTPAQIAGFAGQHLETLHTAVRQGHSLRRMVPARVSTSAAAYWIIAQAAPGSAAAFWGPLLDGIGLIDGSPILVLRNRLIREATLTRKAPPLHILAAFIKAYNAWVEDRPISLLAWRDNEPFPRATEVRRPSSAALPAA